MRSLCAAPISDGQDLRTEYEVGNPGWNLDGFLEAGIRGAIDVMTTSGAVPGGLSRRGTGALPGAVKSATGSSTGACASSCCWCAVLAARFVTGNRVTRPRPPGCQKRRVNSGKQPAPWAQPASGDLVECRSSSSMSLCTGHRCVASSGRCAGGWRRCFRRAALGFGTQRLVQDLLAGFFIIVRVAMQDGGSVELSMVGSPENSRHVGGRRG